MGRIIITENVTLDGVVQDPAGGEGFARGGWTNQFGAPDRDAWGQVLQDEALSAQALLLGRRSEAWLAERWVTRTGTWADRLNSMPKYVVSASLSQPQWDNSTVLSSMDEVAKLKQDTDGDLMVYGSFQLGRALLDHHLVDELRLMTFPVVLGDGQRLFGPAVSPQPMRLVSTRTVGTGLALLSYQPA